MRMVRDMVLAAVERVLITTPNVHADVTDAVLAALGLDDLDAAVGRMRAIDPPDNLATGRDWHRTMLEAALLATGEGD